MFLTFIAAFLEHPIVASLRRTALAVILLLLVGNAFIFGSEYWPQAFGELGAPLTRGFGLVAIGVAVSKVMYAVIDPQFSSRKLLDAVLGGNSAAGLALIARAIIIAVVIVMTCSASRAAEVSRVAPCVPLMKEHSLEDSSYQAKAKVQTAEKDLGPCPDQARSSCCNTKAVISTAKTPIKPVVTQPKVTQPTPPSPPAQALPLLAMLKEEQKTYWPQMTMPSYLAAQIEQETGPCTKTSKSCWNPNAQLKTCREWGVGFYQFTTAYSASCRIIVRFDTLTEAVNAYPKELKGMSWQHWNDPRLQLRAGILKSRDMAKKITGAKDLQNQLMFLASEWNSGAKSLSDSRLSCRAVKGCDPGVWLGNVADHGLLSKVDIPGYGVGQSPFNINRTYVKNLFFVFQPKYKSLDSL